MFTSAECNEAPAMSASAALLSVLLDDDQVITRKELAGLLGVDTRTVSYMAAGRINIPCEVWGRIFERTHDVRIPELILKSSGFVALRMPSAEEIQSGNIPAVMERFRDALERSHVLQDKVLRIISDLRIDADDSEFISELDHLAPQVAAAWIALQRLMQAQYERRQSPAPVRKAVSR